MMNISTPFCTAPFSISLKFESKKLRSVRFFDISGISDKFWNTNNGLLTFDCSECSEHSYQRQIHIYSNNPTLKLDLVFHAPMTIGHCDVQMNPEIWGR